MTPRKPSAGKREPLDARTLRSVARAARAQQRGHERLAGGWHVDHANSHWYRGCAYGFEQTADGALVLARAIESRAKRKGRKA